MEITEVRVELVKGKDDRIRAFCSMTFDDAFVVRDLKVIEGESGYFVAMPSRKMTGRCPRCGGKNTLSSRYRNACGTSLPAGRFKQDAKRRMKMHADIAHPINAACRRSIQDKVVAAFRREVEKSQQPDYKAVELDEPNNEIPDSLS